MNRGDAARGVESAEEEPADELLSDDPVCSIFVTDLLGLYSSLARTGDNFREGGGLRPVAFMFGNSVHTSKFGAPLDGKSFFWTSEL
jgi:hypothetical protein